MFQKLNLQNIFPVHLEEAGSLVGIPLELVQVEVTSNMVSSPGMFSVVVQTDPLLRWLEGEGGAGRRGVRWTWGCILLYIDTKHRCPES